MRCDVQSAVTGPLRLSCALCARLVSQSRHLAAAVLGGPVLVLLCLVALMVRRLVTGTVTGHVSHSPSLKIGNHLHITIL